MLESISEFDPVTGAGILARAALALQEYRQVGEQSRVRWSEETELRQAILAELRRRLGVKSDDNSDDTIERMANMLDDESDALVESVDKPAALLHLSETGHLPSDLFQVELSQDVSRVYGKKTAEERALIEQTVRLPELEQQYGPKQNPSDPGLISMFMKKFPHRYELKSFWMLVVGRRRGLKLDVGQSWRLYPDMVDFAKISEPLDALRQFCEKFGFDVRVGTLQSPLVVHVEHHGTNFKVEFDPNQKSKKDGKVSEAMGSVFFTKYDEQHYEVSMANYIDVGRYRAAIRSRGW